MAELKKIKLLFKAKTQPAAVVNGYRGNKRHITDVDGQMHSGYAKIVDLIGEHIQTK
jgi:hypothetical protein